MAGRAVPVTGRRVLDETGPHAYERGDYGRFEGQWYAVPPSPVGHRMLLAGLAGHTVIEHEDQTITVSPSILVRDGQGSEWHGYLERGVWRTC